MKPKKNDREYLIDVCKNMNLIDIFKNNYQLYTIEQVNEINFRLREVVEASFKTGLSSEFMRMSYEQIHCFEPFLELESEKELLSTIIDKKISKRNSLILETVCKIKYSKGKGEIKFLLKQAAWIFYVRHNGFESFNNNTITFFNVSGLTSSPLHPTQSPHVSQYHF